MKLYNLGCMMQETNRLCKTLEPPCIILESRSVELVRVKIVLVL